MAPAYKRYFVPNAMVFLTLVTAGRKNVFEDPARANTALAILREVKSLHPFKMKAWVVMPDHLHLLIHVIDGRFDRIVHSFKRNLSLEFHRLKMWQGEIWQNRFYDHVIRDDVDLANHVDYIHYNPVHHGFACRPADYPFSSFHHHAQKGRYPVDWGNTLPDNIKPMDLS
jgi:putative transposase